MIKTYDQFWDRLQHAYPISKGKFRLPISTHLLDMEEGFYEEFEKNIIFLTQQAIQVFSDKKTSSQIMEQNKESFLIPYIDETFTGIIRRDCVITEKNEVKVLELNADYPDGLLLHDATYNVLTDDTDLYHTDLYLKLFEDKDDILVLYPKESGFVDAYHTEYLALKQAWKRAYIGHPEDIIIKDNKVYIWDNQIRYIKRCMEIWKLGAEFFDKMKDVDVWFINSFSLRAFGYKNSLSYLDHPYILKTTHISDTDLDHIRSNKDDFVLKPSNLFEGKNVFLGKDTQHHVREAILHTYKDQNYVVQEFAQMSTVPRSFYDDGDIIHREVYFDICPHVFIDQGNIIGIWHTLTRYSTSKILNVALGGGIGYLARK